MPVSAARPNPQSAMQKMQNRFRPSNLELRGPRNTSELVHVDSECANEHGDRGGGARRPQNCDSQTPIRNAPIHNPCMFCYWRARAQ
eukprot:14641347-Alexandrium_andersonii.AAC.1